MRAGYSIAVALPLLLALTGCPRSWQQPLTRGPGPWETKATGTLTYDVTISTFRNGTATTRTAQLRLDAMGDDTVRVRYAGTDFGRRTIDARGQLGGSDDLPPFLDLFAALPATRADLQVGQQWSRRFPADSTAADTSLVLGTQLRGIVSAVQAGLASIDLTGRFAAQPGAGLERFKRDVFGTSPSVQTRAVTARYESGNEFLSGSMQFDIDRGHPRSLRVVVSPDAAVGNAPAGPIEADPNRIEININL